MAALYPSWLSTLNRETLHNSCLLFDDLLLVICTVVMRIWIPLFKLVRIRIRLFTLKRIRILLLISDVNLWPLITDQTLNGPVLSLQYPPWLYFEPSAAPKFWLLCRSGSSFPLWWGSGSGFPKWCGPGSAILVSDWGLHPYCSYRYIYPFRNQDLFRLI